MQPRVSAMVVAGALALGVTLPGCTGGDGDKKTGGLAFSSSQADSVVNVTAKGFSYVGIPPSIKGPEVFFEVTNEDPQTQHEFQVLRTPDGASMGGIPPFNPGETKSVALTLPPGQYIARCMVRAVDTPHGDMGMLSLITVT